MTAIHQDPEGRWGPQGAPGLSVTPWDGHVPTQGSLAHTLSPNCCSPSGQGLHEHPFPMDGAEGQILAPGCCV